MTSFGGEIGYNIENDYLGFLRIMHNSADAQDFDAITAAAKTSPLEVKILPSVRGSVLIIVRQAFYFWQGLLVNHLTTIYQMVLAHLI